MKRMSHYIIFITVTFIMGNLQAMRSSRKASSTRKVHMKKMRAKNPRAKEAKLFYIDLENENRPGLEYSSGNKSIMLYPINDDVIEAEFGEQKDTIIDTCNLDTLEGKMLWLTHNMVDHYVDLGKQKSNSAYVSDVLPDKSSINTPIIIILRKIGTVKTAQDGTASFKKNKNENQLLHLLITSKETAEEWCSDEQEQIMGTQSGALGFDPSVISQASGSLPFSRTSFSDMNGNTRIASPRSTITELANTFQATCKLQDHRQ